MSSSSNYATILDQTLISRDSYTKMLKAGTATGEFRFVHDAALNWLASYPGDLQIGLLYASSLLELEKIRQSLPVFEGLCQADPEFLQAAEGLFKAQVKTNDRQVPDTLAYLLALGGNTGEQETVALWGRQLWLSRLAMQKGNLDQAEDLIRQILAIDPPTPLAAITHLEILEANNQNPLPAKCNLADFYHQRWPNCVQCTLFLADWLMESGEPDRAVALLHQAAVRDVGAQVADRLWGYGHPYRQVWPTNLEAKLNTQVPSTVSAALGWNQLPSEIDQQEKLILVSALPKEAAQAQMQGATSETAQKPDRPPLYTPANLPETLQPIREELEKMAERLNKPGLTLTDGRFPVYVIFSVRSRLESYYGYQAAGEIEAEMSHLAEIVKTKPLGGERRSWGGRVFFPDAPSEFENFEFKSAKPGDPWELKLALADLDSFLAKRGERIGALLIVGGPEIVPFHHLPNPVDDEDPEVPSDNPYATRDENYFIPEWPVGRIPGGSGNDPVLMIKMLRQINTQLRDQTRKEPWYRRFWRRLSGWIKPPHSDSRQSLGYTAAIWKQSSLQVFHPIGEAGAMLISPPVSVNSGQQDGNSRFRLPLAKLGYFNLHGLSDAGEWYGHRDAYSSQDGPDYPVALRPEDIYNTIDNKPAPQVVFSEACYGAHIEGKSISDAMALSFLSAGCQTLVGSTCMAYGSVNKPLVAADLLGYVFWSRLREGLPVGEALRWAKIQLANEMNQRQGYLDGEDQKTLISFVLYGDPLARVPGNQRTSKKVHQSLTQPAEIKTVCDRVDSQQDVQTIPQEVLEYVRHVVNQYLPGMEGARMTFSREHAKCNTSSHKCPTSQLHTNSQVDQTPNRRLVTLSKRVQRADHVHNQYARLTLDAKGKLVKLVVSR
jgi:tetratricopeptide (TPR) repeat protein